MVRRPRYGMLGLLTVLAVSTAARASGDGAATPRSGRLEVVQHWPSAMVLVPAGSFIRGFPSGQEGPAHESQWICERAVGVAGEHWCAFEKWRTWTWLDPMTVHGLNYLIPQINAVGPSEVFLPAFEIDRFEVTVADYRRCVRAGRCDSGPLLQGDQRHHQERRNPITQVTWRDASDYCEYAGKRLPTEAEWEKAARGTDGRTWPWGEQSRSDGGNFGRMEAESVRRTRTMDLGRLVTMAPEAGFETAPGGADGVVSLVPPGSLRWSESRYGALDMAGNVAEWVLDYYDPFGYGELPADAPVRRSPASTSDARRVVRGGSFLDLPLAGRTYARSAALPGTRSLQIGFRCARDAR
jgi:formylglycine-generating enzyme required for sulfatase activity